MLLPLMALFMLGIPGIGFLSGISLLFFKRLRFLTPFAFLMPLFGAYMSIAGFWGAAIGLESLGMSEGISAIGGLLCLFISGVLGSWIAYGIPKSLTGKNFTDIRNLFYKAQ